MCDFFNLHSPLEQFVVLPLSGWAVSLGFGNFVLFPFSNVSLMLGWVAVIFFGIIVLLSRSPSVLFSRLLVVNARFFIFLVTLLRENIIRKSFYFLSFLYVLFSFLLIANLLSMVPYSFALTSHLIVTLLFSFLAFAGALSLGFQVHGLKFFGLFLPAGAPFFLAPFLITVEAISYTARLFSLAIRLFANIMSGHTLLKILASFAWILFAVLLSGVAIIPILIVFVVTALEIVIAMLQAYVFSILASIYSNEALQLH